MMRNAGGGGKRQMVKYESTANVDPMRRVCGDARRKGRNTCHGIVPSLVVLRAAIPALVSVLFLTGCLPGAKPPYTVQSYFLEYEAPTPNLPQLSAIVKIGRFSAVRSYDTSAMLYSSEPYRVGTYNYSRWSAYPSELVADSLLRDLRNANLFLAVFSYRDQADARFTIAGSIEEFLQARTAEGWQVILSVRIALLDAERPGPVVFQRRYRNTRTISSRVTRCLCFGDEPGHVGSLARVSSRMFTRQYARRSVAGRAVDWCDLRD